MKTSRSWMFAFSMLACATGCGASAGEQLRADVKELQKEHTADKLVERGRAFASIGDFTRAEEYFTAAMDAGAPPRKVMPMLVKACLSDNRLRSVIQYSEGYLAKFPDDVATRFVYGTVLYAVGDYSQAKTELARVTVEKPLIADAHFALALADRELGHHHEADTQFREYLRLAPRGTHAAEAESGLTKTFPTPMQAP